jgi:hypothetical protein
MTKIKDLVSVTYDTLVASFPVDLERYELLVWILHSALWAEVPTALAMRVHGNDAMRSFLTGTYDNFIQSAKDASHAAAYPVSATAGQKDRQKRLEASFADFQPPSGYGEYGCCEELCRMLWCELVRRAVKDGATVGVS